MAQSLFRSIRMKLLDEGKTFKYLKYAIGEILLIIIGIMIALQLNNMNEDRKAQVEFELYVVQLREDVGTAIDNVQTIIRVAEIRASDCAAILPLLKHNDYTAEELQVLERGLEDLGKYPEIEVHTGLLGQLLNGNMEVLGRNNELARKAMKMESSIERSLGVLSHIYNQLDLAAVNLLDFRGQGLSPLNIEFKYNLTEIRTSDNFLFTAQKVIHQTYMVGGFAEGIKKELEEFLTVLEEYE